MCVSRIWGSGKDVRWCERCEAASGEKSEWEGSMQEWGSWGASVERHLQCAWLRAVDSATLHLSALSTACPAAAASPPPLLLTQACPDAGATHKLVDSLPHTQILLLTLCADDRGSAV